MSKCLGTIAVNVWSSLLLIKIGISQQILVNIFQYEISLNLFTSSRIFSRARTFSFRLRPRNSRRASTATTLTRVHGGFVSLQAHFASMRVYNAVTSELVHPSRIRGKCCHYS
jgi:hypothetical protein